MQKSTIKEENMKTVQEKNEKSHYLQHTKEVAKDINSKKVKSEEFLDWADTEELQITVEKDSSIKDLKNEE